MTIPFDSGWEQARDIILEIIILEIIILEVIILEIVQTEIADCEEAAREQLRTMTSEYFVQMNVLSSYVYVSLGESGVKLTLRHLTATRGRRTVRHDLITQTLRRFQANDTIHITYPTYRIEN